MAEPILKALKSHKAELDTQIAEIELKITRLKGMEWKAKADMSLLQSIVWSATATFDLEALYAARTKLKEERERVNVQIAAHQMPEQKHVDAGVGYAVKQRTSKEKSLKTRIKELIRAERRPEGVTISGVVIERWLALLRAEGYNTKAGSIRATLSILGYARARKAR